ncbi:MAG: sugar ABC transporter ATP-binding protein [Actinomycetota bacterium]|nr:sugar ABC transporter ATP-binding protein [Actinomycetota bacterium]
MRVEPAVELKDLTVRFPAVTALDGVSMSLQPGEVRVLLGENGAGKSTLIKVLAGVVRPTSGEVLIAGDSVTLTSPRHALAMGVSTVFQELSLVPTLTVAENLVLGHLPSTSGLVSWRSVRQAAEGALERVGADINPRTKVERLPRSSQQLVEIARGLMGEPRVLILDEPTSSLGEQESERLLGLVQALAGRGIAVIYITHRLHEIERIAHHITVLRDGKLVATVESDDVGDNDHLVELMTGQRPSSLYPRTSRHPGGVAFATDDLQGPELHGVTLGARYGEIVGIAGLIGSGKSSLVRTVFGLDPVDAGQVMLHGRPFVPRNPSHSLSQGIAYYPSDRKREGLALNQPLRTNITLGSLNAIGASKRGFLARRPENTAVQRAVDSLRIRPNLPNRRTEMFSGGNQQKAVLARGLLHSCPVHLFDEPTVGIDVGAKADVYRLMDQLANDGKAVVLVSSDLPEVMGMADRLYVLHEGRVTAHLGHSSLTEAAVLEAFFGPGQIEEGIS